MSDIKTMCRTDRHQFCGGHACSCDCHPGTPEERASDAQTAVTEWLAELGEVTSSTGRHEGHTLEQAGSCVYCSCGYRFQGSLPKGRAS